MRKTNTLAALVLGTSLLAAPAVSAHSGNPAARASGDMAGSSVEAAATLGSVGVTTTAASVVAITGSTAAIVTANPELADASLAMAAEIAAAPFDSGTPLPVDDAVIVPDSAPAVPYAPEGEKHP